MYVGVNGLDPKINDISIFSDRQLTLELDNPQILNSNGRSTNKIWIEGEYSFSVENTNDVQQLIDLDAGEVKSGGTIILSNVQGSNTITATANPAITSYVNGQIYTFQPVITNTGPTTLNIDNLGEVAINSLGVAMVGGELIAGLNFLIAFNDGNTEFDLLTIGSSNQPVGGGTDNIFYENEQNVTTDYTVTATTNSMSAGPITIDSGITVTIETGGVWVIL